MRVALAAILLALVACAPRPSGAGAPDRPYAWTAVDAPPAPLTVPVSLFEIVYSRDGELYRTVVDAGTLATVSEVSLGNGIAFHQISGTASLIVEDYAGPIVVNGRGDRHRYGRAPMPLPVGGISMSGVVYVGGGDRIAIADTEGNVMRSFEAPRAAPGLPAVPLAYKGALIADASAVEGFIFDAARSFVVVSGSANTAILDLDTGRRLDLTGVLALDVADRDGHAYLVGLDVTSLDRRMVMAEIDLGALDVIRRTTFTPASAGAIDHVRALVSPRGDVYVYVAVAVGATSVPIRSDLISFDPGLASRHVALPNDLGLDATVGADGALFIFGGPGRNVVTRFDPLTRDLTRYAVAPDGTFVRALDAR